MLRIDEPSDIVCALSHATAPLALLGCQSAVASWAISREAVTNAGTIARRSLYIYDAMGRLKAVRQCTPVNCSPYAPYVMTFAYDLTGNLVSSTNGITNPGILLTSSYDAAGRLAALTSSWNNDASHPGTLFSAVSYGPLGLTQARLGVNSSNQPALTLSRSYDNRGRITGKTDSGGALTGGSHTLVNNLSNLFLDDPNSSKTAGNIVQSNENGAVDEQWSFTSNGSGYYTIQNAASGLFLTDINPINTPGANLQQQAQSSTDTQLWSVIPIGTGYVVQISIRGWC